MLRDGIGFSRVIICCGRVDLRKGIPGLTAYVKLNYGLDTTEKGTLFLFCGNRTDRIKGLRTFTDKKTSCRESFPMAPDT